MIVDWRFKNFLLPVHLGKRQFRTDVPLAPFVPVIAPMIAAFTVAALIAASAHRLGLLTVSGAAAAAMVGGATLFAGLSWAILLLFFFTTSTATVSR